MMTFAPGKLVLSGAYAVLAGAPAVVMATTRGAFADGTRATDCPTDEVRAAFGQQPAPHVDASCMFMEGRKLGLGASSAIVVASLGVQAAMQGRSLSDPLVRSSIFDHARAAHSAAQGGGSGVDIAASVYGGLLEYRAGVAQARVMPTGVLVRVFACSESARTSELRARVDRFALESPEQHAACFRDLTTIAEEAAACVRNNDGRGWIRSIHSAALALRTLGEKASTCIVPAHFAELEAAASREGAAFCVSGAGGGDVAVFVGHEAPSAAFEARARAMQLTALDVGLDTKGVRSVTLALDDREAAASTSNGPNATSGS